jgi:hypothetical protein
MALCPLISTEDHQTQRTPTVCRLKGVLLMTDPSTVTLLECSCGHLREQHDSIAARFCDATDLHHLTRSCICKPAPVTP